MSNLMPDIEVRSLIKITNRINVLGFRFKVDLKIVRNLTHAVSNREVKHTQTAGGSTVALFKINPK